MCVYPGIVRETLACCATCEMADWLACDEAVPPEVAVILDIREAEKSRTYLKRSIMQVLTGRL